MQYFGYMLLTRSVFVFAVFSPDPYVTIQLLGTPNGIKRTKHIPSSSEPQWNETLEFYIDPKRDRIIGKNVGKGFSIEPKIKD